MNGPFRSVCMNLTKTQNLASYPTKSQGPNLHKIIINVTCLSNNNTLPGLLNYVLAQFRVMLKLVTCLNVKTN